MTLASMLCDPPPRAALSGRCGGARCCEVPAAQHLAGDLRRRLLTAPAAAICAHRDGAESPGSAEVRAMRAWRHTAVVCAAALSLALAAVVAW